MSSYRCHYAQSQGTQMVKKRGLGRGLDALLSGGLADEDAASGAAGGNLKDIPVDLLDRGRYQPRVDMRKETLAGLAESIRAQGVVQPIVVRPVGAGRYEIIAGERRWRAAQLAGLQEMPAIVRDVPDEAAIAMALIENIQRENLTPLEEASALRRLIDEFDMSHQAAGDAVGRSRAAVSNLLRLLEIAPAVRPWLESGELEMGHARAILPLPPEKQLQAAKTIVKRGFSVRQAEALSKSLRKPNKKKASADPKKDPDVLRLENDLSDRLAAKVAISANQAGRGKVQISFNSLDELQGILEHIR